MNKGYFLNKWLNIADALHAKKMQLFTDNNCAMLDLRSLPESAKDEWDALQKKSNRVADKMTSLILNK